jgi:hypothetical protein
VGANMPLAGINTLENRLRVFRIAARGAVNRELLPWGQTSWGQSWRRSTEVIWSTGPCKT